MTDFQPEIPIARDDVQTERSPLEDATLITRTVVDFGPFILPNLPQIIEREKEFRAANQISLNCSRFGKNQEDSSFAFIFDTSIDVVASLDQFPKGSQQRTALVSSLYDGVKHLANKSYDDMKLRGLNENPDEDMYLAKCSTVALSILFRTGRLQSQDFIDLLSRTPFDEYRWGEQAIFFELAISPVFGSKFFEASSDPFVKSLYAELSGQGNLKEEQGSIYHQLYHIFDTKNLMESLRDMMEKIEQDFGVRLEPGKISKGLLGIAEQRGLEVPPEWVAEKPQEMPDRPFRNAVIDFVAQMPKKAVTWWRS